MTHLRTLALLLLCSAVSACGNKGDLFLVPSEATEADLESVDEVLDELEGNLGELPSEIDLTDDNPDNGSDNGPDNDNKDDDDRRKRKLP